MATPLFGASDPVIETARPLFGGADPIVGDAASAQSTAGMLGEAALSGLETSRRSAAALAGITGAVSPETAAEAIASQTFGEREYEPPPEVQKLAKEIDEGNWWEAAKTLLGSPVKTAGTIGVQGLATSVIPIATGAMGAAAGATIPIPGATIAGGAAGLGVGSGLVDAGATIMETMAESGVNLRDPVAVAAAFRNQGLMAVAKDKAVKRGIAVGAFDAASGVIAGRFLAGAKGFMSALGRGGAEVGVQAGLGGAGEAAAQLATEGRIKSPSDVAFEAIGELGPGAVEAVGGSALRRRMPAVPLPPAAATVPPVVPPEEAQAPTVTTPPPEIAGAPAPPPAPQPAVPGERAVLQAELDKITAAIPPGVTPAPNSIFGRRLADLQTRIDALPVEEAPPIVSRETPPVAPPAPPAAPQVQPETVEAPVPAPEPPTVPPPPGAAPAFEPPFPVGTAVNVFLAGETEPVGTAEVSGYRPGKRPRVVFKEPVSGLYAPFLDLVRLTPVVAPVEPAPVAPVAPPQAAPEPVPVPAVVAPPIETPPATPAVGPTAQTGAGVEPPAVPAQVTPGAPIEGEVDPFAIPDHLRRKPGEVPPAPVAAPEIRMTPKRTVVRAPKPPEAIAPARLAGAEKRVFSYAAENNLDLSDEQVTAAARAHLERKIAIPEAVREAGGKPEVEEVAAAAATPAPTPTPVAAAEPVAPSAEARTEPPAPEPTLARDPMEDAVRQGLEFAADQPSEFNQILQTYGQVFRELNSDLDPHRVAQFFGMEKAFHGDVTLENLKKNFEVYAHSRANELERYRVEPPDTMRLLTGGADTYEKRRKYFTDEVLKQFEGYRSTADTAEALNPGSGQAKRIRQMIEDKTAEAERKAQDSAKAKDAAEAEEAARKGRELLSRYKSAPPKLPSATITKMLGDRAHATEDGNLISNGHWLLKEDAIPALTERFGASKDIWPINKEGADKIWKAGEKNSKQSFKPAMIGPDPISMDSAHVFGRVGNSWVRLDKNYFYYLDRQGIEIRGNPKDTNEALGLWKGNQMVGVLMPMQMKPDRQDALDRIEADLSKAEPETTETIETEEKFSIPPEAARKRDQGEMFSIGRDVTQTPEFKRWFGDSKVVDENGEPLVVYHGTTADVESFDPKKLGSVTGARSAKFGFFFAGHPAVASSYATEFDPYRDTRLGRFLNKITMGLNKPINEGFLGLFGMSAIEYGGNVVPAYLSLQNPMVIDYSGGDFRDRSYFSVVTEAKVNGFDGVILKNTRDPGYSDDPAAYQPTDVFVVFNPTQIKSAIGNRGTFDPTDPRITYSLRREGEAIRPDLDIDRVLAELTERLRAIDPKGRIALRLKETIESARTGKATAAQGRYLNRLIEVALSAAAKGEGTWVLNHEAIHGLRDLGVFRDAEWAALEKAALADETAMQEVRDRYAGQGLSEEALVEERAADMFADWAAQRKPAQGFVLRAFQRVRAFLKGFAASLRKAGYRTVEDIFEGVEAGKVGRREGAAGRTGRERLAAAWHGTPHEWAGDRADLSKIGTGEGAQAYGWGLYFADKKGVAEYYRAAGQPSYLDASRVEAAKAVLKEVNGDRTAAINIAHERMKATTKYGEGKLWQDVVNNFDALVNTKIGRLYRVNLAPTEDEYLYWDKPLSEQTEKVKAAIANMNDPGDNYATMLGATTEELDESLHGDLPVREITGMDFYREMAFNINPKEASLKLYAAGIPGIKYLDQGSRAEGEGSYNYVIFDDSLVTVEEKFALWPRRTATPRTDLERDLSTVMDLPEKKSVFRHIADTLTAWRLAREDIANEVVRGLFDKFNPVKVAETRLFGDVLNAAVGAFKMMHATTNLSSTMATVVGVKTKDGIVGGALRYNDKTGKVELVEGSKPLTEIFRPVAALGGEAVNAWKAWAIARRAKMLMAEDREKNVPQWFIDKYENIDQEYMRDGRNVFQDVFDDWRTFNNQMLDFAEQAGTINKEQRALWDDAFYIPFYRIIEEETLGLGVKSGIANQTSGIKRLTGGEDVIGDVIENIVLNTTKLVDSSFKTIAMSRAMPILEAAGDVTEEKADWRQMHAPVPAVTAALKKIGVHFDKLTKEQREQWLAVFAMAPPRGKDIVFFMDKGKRRYFRVQRPDMLAALTAMHPEQMNVIMKTMGWVKGGFTELVTADPAFMIANGIRDTLHAWIITHGKVKLGTGAARGFRKALEGSPELISIMAAGYGTGGFYKNSSIRKVIESPAHQRTILGRSKDAYDAYRKLGFASEYMNRIARYEAGVKGKEGPAEAAYQAMDLLNFSAHGAWKVTKFLTTVVPFMNARLQGLHRLGRGYKEDPRAFLLHAGLLTAASLALWFVNKDDDRYKALPDWDKDTYYHFFLDNLFPDGALDAAGIPTWMRHIRLPKPFEIGAFFSTIPERMASLANGDDKLRHTLDSVQRILLDTFAFNPLPQAVKPIIEQVADKNFFTGRPIEGMRYEGLRPEARYGPDTSETARLLGKALPEWAGDVRSPVRLEHLVRGYFGTIGMYVLGALDAILRPLATDAEAPTRRLDQYPVVQRFLRLDPPFSTKWMTEFYDMKREVDAIHQTLNKYRKEGDVEAYRTLRTEKATELALRKGLNKAHDLMRDIDDRIERVKVSKAMGADSKREAIDGLLARKQMVAKRYATLRPD